ncbi:MAG: NYN domain-containing protein [Eubacteriales bacterium]|nr:NYN domain-containing protein [Eubacteriales bacterium]
MKVAILIDGAFYTRRAMLVWGKQNPRDAATMMIRYCKAHLEQAGEDAKLYRIFYYDCPPPNLHAVNPISKKPVHMIKTEGAKWRLGFFKELTKKRKLALRKGKIDEENPTWKLAPERIKDLFNNKITLDELDERDVQLDIRQKGVDMRIGLDIASMCYKKQVDQIILIAGDSDFVPAAKLARREGVDFILDPMWMPIKDDLFEHIDGLHSQIDNPAYASKEEKGRIKSHRKDKPLK